MEQYCLSIEEIKVVWKQCTQKLLARLSNTIRMDLTWIQKKNKIRRTGYPVLLDKTKSEVDLHVVLKIDF